MMKRVTKLMLVAALGFLFSQSALAQDSEFLLNVPTSDDFTAGYTKGIHSGARSVAGPYDLDGDGLYEVLVSDYTGGGRVHVIENVSADTWELVYSTPWLDSTATTNNIRVITGADLDGDGFGEILFLSGRNFSEFNPNIADLPVGLYVFENQGDNDFGTAPTTIYNFGDNLPDRWRAEQMAVADVDGDGKEELMFGNNGSSNTFDNWYVISVDDIGSGFDTWTVEMRLSSRATEDFDPVARGGGSPYAIHPADLNGDGVWDLSLHSYNAFNLTNVTVTGADTYVAPADGATNGFLNASSTGDDVAFFGGTVVDIDGNGDDEIFYPISCIDSGSSPAPTCGSVLLFNYEDGEDVMQVTMDNVAWAILPGMTSFGITSGDLDGDGAMEVITGGPAYGAGSFSAGNAPSWINIAEFNGGDPEDGANYSIQTLEYFDPIDADSSAFDLVVRDSAGVITEYLETGDQGSEFVSKLAYLGDADMDGYNEVVIGFQGVDDSTYVYDEVFNPSDSTYTRTIRSSKVNPDRVFMRVLSGNGRAVSIEDERIVIPSDYKLHANYPNPFNPTTTISFTLPLEKAISVRVYDMTGRLVRNLVNNQVYPAGTFEVVWDGTGDAGNSVASGSYIYSLEYGNFRQARTMVLVK
ncbi:MAG: FlgD immunoglobulin-like domain containing protein [Rhodothermales bacterium]